MKNWKLGLCVAAASMAMAGAASAQTWSYNVGVASDYVFRGIDQTADLSGSNDSGVETFGGIDVSVDMFYAGVWVSNTGPNNEDGIEYDIYGGVKPTLGPVALDLGLIFYGYNTSNGGTVSSVANTVEIKVAGSVPLGGLTVGAAGYYSPEFGFFGGTGFYYEANAAYTFENKATVNIAVGHQNLESSNWGVNGYTTWNAGTTYPITDHFTIDARFIGTEQKAAGVGSRADNKFVATLKATF